MCVASLAFTQSTTPGAGIDVEVFSPDNDEANTFCVAQGETFWAYLWVSPGDTSTTCDLTCGTGVAGGRANISSGTVDISFDPTMLTLDATEPNPDVSLASIDGIFVEQNLAAGRIGWALAGDWTPNGATDGALANPCEMLKLSSPQWVARFAFTVTAQGTSTLHIRTEPEGALSFSDICGSGVFGLSNGGINEVVDATVSTDAKCVPDIFADGFESGDSSHWH